LGISIPDTLISNDPNSVRAFFQKHEGRIIAKMHVPYSWKDKHGRLSVSGTIPIRQTDLQQNASIEGAPVIYQELVTPKTELRIIAFGQNVYTISQKHRADEGGT